MSIAIDWTHLSENYRGKWVALAEDLTMVGFMPDFSQSGQALLGRRE